MLQRINKKEQMCYLVCINDFNDGSIFHIVKRNLKIDTAPLVPFASKKCVQASAAAPGDAVNNNCLSNRNVTANIKGGGLLRVVTREEINQLQQQGIIVANDNEPAPENLQAPVQGAALPPGTWETPQYCCRRENANFSNQADKFVHHRWDKIADMDKLQLFCVCFSEKWIVDLVISQTNKALGKPMDLQEFYV